MGNPDRIDGEGLCGLGQVAVATQLREKESLDEGDEEDKAKAGSFFIPCIPFIQAKRTQKGECGNAPS